MTKLQPTVCIQSSVATLYFPVILYYIPAFIAAFIALGQRAVYYLK